MPCRHCQTKKANRPCVLCWTCYYTPSVRKLYGWKDARSNNRGVGSEEPKSECQPTTALPGSAEKIAVMMARAEVGQPLFHKDDACEKVPSYLKTGGEPRLNDALVDPECLQGVRVSTILERAFAFPKERPGP